MKLALRLILGQRCRECGNLMDSDRRQEAHTNIKLFGLKPGWRLCRCGERVTSKVRAEIRDKNGVIRHVYRRVYVEAGEGDGLDHWSCHRQDGGKQ